MPDFRSRSFDATYLYDYSLIMLFNLVFTSLPVAVLGIVSPFRPLFGRSS